MRLDHASVVICTHNQASRLRLVLRALSVSEVMPNEIIIADDASTDETSAVLATAASWFPGSKLLTTRLTSNLGSPGARNAGARLATGDLLLFLDGDALPTRAHIGNHLEAQRASGPLGLFGPLWHTTTTEYLRDPSTGARFEVDIPVGVRVALDADPNGTRITEEDVLERFEGIVARSAPGSYPPLGKMEAAGQQLGDAAGHGAAWLLMSPQNFSVPRASFEAVGGFDATLPFSEGWDLTLRLARAGVPTRREPRSPIYHLYHHRKLTAFSEGLRRYVAMKMIAQKLGHASLELGMLFFNAIGGDPWLPHGLALDDLDTLAAIFATWQGSERGPLGRILDGHPHYSELEEAFQERRTA